jgi:hypothetical protein
MYSVWFKVTNDFVSKKLVMVLRKILEANRRNQRKKRNAGVTYTFK